VQRLNQGQIVTIVVPDPRGKNKKPRPVLILTDSDELTTAEEFVVAAISTQFSDPLPADCVLIPSSRDVRAKTGLMQPSVVKCHWLLKVRRRHVRCVLGHLPPEIMCDVMRIVVQM